jgi:hypothetical protein
MKLLTRTTGFSTASTIQKTAPQAVANSQTVGSARHKIAKILLAIGLLMMGASLVNLPSGRLVNPLTLPLCHYAHAVATGNEPFELTAATLRVHQGIVHQEPRFVGPGENWLQAILGTFYPPIKTTQDTDRLLAGGIANCSERSQILKTIAESAGYQCRFVGLQGHVVLEVLDGEQWLMADPDYGVVFDLDVASLALPDQQPVVVAALTDRGYPYQTIARYLEILQSTNDNQTLPTGSPLSPRLHKIEQACSWLIWMLPATAIALGLSPVLIGPRTRRMLRIKRSQRYKGITSRTIQSRTHTETEPA